MYKIVNGLAPQCLTDLFISKNDISHYKLRGSSNSLQLPLPKTEFARVEQNCGTRFLLHFDGESDTLSIIKVMCTPLADFCSSPIATMEKIEIFLVNRIISW